MCIRDRAISTGKSRTNTCTLTTIRKAKQNILTVISPIIIFIFVDTTQDLNHTITPFHSPPPAPLKPPVNILQPVYSISFYLTKMEPLQLVTSSRIPQFPYLTSFVLQQQLFSDIQTFFLFCYTALKNRNSKHFPRDPLSQQFSRTLQNNFYIILILTPLYRKITHIIQLTYLSLIVFRTTIEISMSFYSHHINITTASFSFISDPSFRSQDPGTPADSDVVSVPPGSGASYQQPGNSDAAISGMMATMGTTPPSDQVKIARDLNKVNEAVWQVGGMMANKPPDMEAMKARKGQRTDVVVEDLNIGDLAPTPQRPDESTLPKLTPLELLPPPSTAPIPLDHDDTACLGFVREQKIEFLLIQKPVSDPSAPWSFPPEDVVQKVFEHAREECDHDQVIDVVMWNLSLIHI